MDRDRTTPQYIESLKEGEVFVFGSNKEGMHGGGAAAKAFRDFGAEWGEGYENVMLSATCGTRMTCSGCSGCGACEKKRTQTDEL